MITKALAASVALALVAPGPKGAAIPDPSGDWTAVVSEAAPFPLVLHVSEDVRLDNPAHQLFGVPVELAQAGDQVSLVFATGGRFDGVLRGDRLQGDYSRGGGSLPLVFCRQRSWLQRLAQAIRPPRRMDSTPISQL